MNIETLIVVLTLAAAAAQMLLRDSGTTYRLMLATANGTVAPYTFTPSPPSLTPSNTSDAVHLANAGLGWLIFSRLHQLIYALDHEGGKVVAIEIDPDDSSLTPFDETFVGDGTQPTHGVILKDHRLVTANYGTGSISVFKLNVHDGSFTADQADLTVLLPRSSPTLRSCAHQIVPDPSDRWLYVPDLCADTIYQLSQIDFSIINSTTVPKASGPRHMVFYTSTRTLTVHAYLASEISATLTALVWSADHGSLSTIGDPQSALPPGAAATNHTTSEVAISPDGKYVYVGTRSDAVEDHVAVFVRDDSDGSVKFREWVPSGGRHLRHFSLSPDPNALYLAAAHRDTHNVTILRRDPLSGALSKTTATAQDVGPVWYAGFFV